MSKLTVYLARHYDDLLEALLEHLQITAVTLLFSLLIASALTILAIYSKLVEKKDAGTLMSFINYSLDNVKTNMSPNEITSLAVDIVGSGVSFESSRVPFDGEWKYAKKEGKSVLSIDLADNVEKLHDFLY